MVDAALHSAADAHLSLRRARGRRLLLVLPSLALAILALALSVGVLLSAPHGALDWALLVPFALVMAWEGLMVWQLVLGFASWLRGREALTPLERRAGTVEPVATGLSRTALVVPICDEDPEAVFAYVEIARRSIARTGRVDDVDIHVLSDTRRPAVAADEHRLWAAMPAAPELPAVFYRHRATNTGRKAGNVMEMFDRTGDAYDFAVVLDADSLMSGAAIRRLIRLMEENPRVGIVQTVSYATGHETLFARIQQFAVRLYAPLALRGLDFWQGAESSYWGHNAILRVAPFRAHCRLPVLPGVPPFGGEILCHDVVEAALMARAGWDTRLLPEFDGTWEEMPTNTVDLMGRERRWCQGNLQHARILGLPGLKSASRGHILLGIGGYLTAPLWWLFVLGGAARVLLGPWLGAKGGLGLLAYGATERGPAAAGLLALAAVLILVPRVLNLVRAFGDARLRAEFGGTGRLAAGAALEQGIWLLLGPLLSLVNAGFVLWTVLGRVVPWVAQSRADRHVTLAEAWRCHSTQVMVGVALAVSAWAAGGWYALWLAPSYVGLIVSPVLTSALSRVDLGRLSHRAGLFVTVDDTAPAPEILELRAASGA
ncbi:glucans biosynthesis glucosyltransferase MdoH [Lichenibacterium dinghuense]|uniref:glucans biosynthesis glucosyltransferase MdoH n=1 Tax=Lichenibacterium dinghuense TaxID=2895977 RepID=UPI001F3CE60A|nr:glucans biosynthesis glucosyltransferase MdoH [Lichenibacterium sp. 6Y81]